MVYDVYSKGIPGLKRHRKQNQYINVLWHCIDKRVKKTDFSESQCAFSEASAETVVSVYGRVTEGRGSMRISNARIALH